MRIAIVDDDLAFTNKLKQMLYSIGKKNAIPIDIHTYSDGLSFANDERGYEVVFLDIQMPEFSGFDVCEAINSKRHDDLPYVVFISNDDSLLVKTQKYFPLIFIRKCDIEVDLERVVKHISTKLQQLVAELAVKDVNGNTKIKISDIVYFAKNGNYIDYYTEDNKYTERSTISAKIAELEPYGFVMINSGTAVNLRCVKKITKDSTAVLQNDTIIAVTKTMLSSVKEKFIKWRSK